MFAFDCFFCLYFCSSGCLCFCLSVQSVQTALTHHYFWKQLWFPLKSHARTVRYRRRVNKSLLVFPFVLLYDHQIFYWSKRKKANGTLIRFEHREICVKHVYRACFRWRQQTWLFPLNVFTALTHIQEFLPPNAIPATREWAKLSERR